MGTNAKVEPSASPDMAAPPVTEREPAGFRDAARRAPLRRRTKGVIAALIFATLAIAALWWHLRPRSTAIYVTAPVTRGDVAPYVTASGSVNPTVTVQVGTYVSGVLEHLYCDYNTRVAAGQLCAKIDPRPYPVVVDQDRAALAAAEAQLAKDGASLAYAKISFHRQETLAAEYSASQDAADVGSHHHRSSAKRVADPDPSLAVLARGVTQSGRASRRRDRRVGAARQGACRSADQCGIER